MSINQKYKLDYDEKNNTILILFDELINYPSLPSQITDKLKGYQAFKKMGIEFTNIQTSRQQCTPSRSTIPTGTMDTGLQDNIDYTYQFDYIKQLPSELNTVAKEYKYNNYLTAYYGKQHLDALFADSYTQTPLFSQATTGGMRQYGYDIFNPFGDTYYFRGRGIFGDSVAFNLSMPLTSEVFDYKDKDGFKYSGIIPFLKARSEDNQQFYLECQFTNPHDTTSFWENFETIPSMEVGQYPIPFLEDQNRQDNTDNPFFFSDKFPDAVIQHPNLKENYFEDSFYLYQNNFNTLPYIESYELDYPISPIVNTTNPFLVGTYNALEMSLTMPSDKSQIGKWKNLINNYYGLIFEADSYLFKLYETLEKLGFLQTCNIIIIADHADQMSAHGIKQKQLVFKECSNVPCIICSPKLDPSLRGTSSSVYGSLIDITPTQFVLNGITPSGDTSTFVGTSLLERSINGLVVNREHDNYIPFNFVNSTMYTLNYFEYLPWKLNNKNVPLTFDPKNYFEFQSSFQSIIVNVQGNNYKYGRYFSLLSVIKYNFEYSNLSSIIKFEFIENFIRTFFFKLFSKFANLSGIISSIIQTFQLILPSLFTFDIGLQKVINFCGKSTDNYFLYLYLSATSFLLASELRYKFIIPGALTDWNVNSINPDMTFFLYDIDNDPNEIKNLFDPKYSKDVPLDLANILNDTLNNRILETKMINPIYIIPTDSLVLLSFYLYIVGGFINERTSTIILENMFFFLGGKSSIDGNLTEDRIQIINEVIDQQLFNLFNVQITNINEPFIIYDTQPSSENFGIVYLGTAEYVLSIATGEYFKLIFNEPIIKPLIGNISDKAIFVGVDTVFPKLFIFKDFIPEL